MRRIISSQRSRLSSNSEAEVVEVIIEEEGEGEVLVKVIYSVQAAFQ